MKRIKKNWDEKKVKTSLDNLFSCYDDGELFVEEVFSENILFDDNKIKNASYDQDKGFGLRTVVDDTINFCHNTELSEEAINASLNSIKKSKKSIKSINNSATIKSNSSLYTSENPLNGITLSEKIDFLNKINNYARKIDINVKEVSISLNGNHQNIEVTTKDGNLFYDSRPLVRMNLNILVQKKGKIESGSFGMGGRYLYDHFFKENVWKEGVNKAFNQAIVKLSAKETPADKLVGVGDRVLFDYDSSNLSSDAKLTLDKQSRFLRVNSDLTFTIEGHCDERGTREYNLALGEKRATAVRDYLVIEGISPDRIRVISYGKEKPAVVGSNDMAWSKNRRAVTTID